MAKEKLRDQLLFSGRDGEFLYRYLGSNDFVERSIQAVPEEAFNVLIPSVISKRFTPPGLVKAGFSKRSEVASQFFVYAEKDLPEMPFEIHRGRDVVVPGNLFWNSAVAVLSNRVQLSE